MTEPIDALMARLRAEYLAEMPDRLDEMLAAIDGKLPVEHGRQLTLPQLFHRLAGSAGAYGYGEVTRLCRDGEVTARQRPADTSRLRDIVAAIREAFDRAPTDPSIDQD